MTSILGIGTSALAAFRRSLSTVGQNIANVNTEGYSRQTVNLVSREPQFTGVGFVGNGVEIASIERSYNSFLDAQARTAGSSASRFEALSNFAARVDNLLADPSSSLSTALNSFFGQLQDFSTNPSSSAARSGLVAESENLTQRFQSVDQALAGFGNEARAAIVETVGEINQIAGQIAELNTKITQSAQTQPPNDLLDQRDRLIRDLSALVDVTVVNDASGSTNLFIGNGQTLVIGAETYELAAAQSEFDPTRNEIVYRGLSGDTPISDVLRGGRIGALFEFESEILNPTRRAIGAAAVALTQALNAQNAQGLNADDALGGDLLSIGPPLAVASSLNTGSGSINVSIDDLSSVANSEYRLINDAGSFRLFRLDTGAELALSGTGTAGDPLTADGLSIVVSGTLDNGDQFSIEPTLNAVAGFRNLTTTGREFAAAAPVRATASVNNLSDATIDNGTVVDIDNPALLNTVNITFTDPTTYSVNGAGSFTFTPGTAITINGAEYVISGEPATGDVFTIEANTNAQQDNRNALALADIETRGLLDNGETNIGQSYASLVAEVGSVTRQANASAEAQSILFASATTRLQEASGVDLDQEAADLIRFQQSFQAAAQVISVASTLFDTLLAATRR
ncbi:MAG: flagellar hook-associated protein FlgK [Pseudomonadota bacterium]